MCGPTPSHGLVLAMRARTISAATIGFSANSAIRTMLYEDELALYYMTARDAYRARGAVIEIGPWLGGGTEQICRGLDASQHDWSLTVIDRFTWGADGQRKWPEGGLTIGQSFLPQFQKNLSAYISRILPVAAELKDMPAIFAPSERIELLFVDAPKSWSMLRMLFGHLGPHLLPGASIIFQDFLHVTARGIVWLLMSMPQIKIEAAVAKGESVLVTVGEPLVNFIDEVPPSVNHLSVADLIRCWEKAVSALPEDKTGRLSIGLAMDLLLRNANQDAFRVLDMGVSGQPWEPAVVQNVDYLIEFGNRKNKAVLSTIVDHLRHK